MQQLQLQVCKIGCTESREFRHRKSFKVGVLGMEAIGKLYQGLARTWDEVLGDLGLRVPNPKTLQRF